MSKLFNIQACDYTPSGRLLVATEAPELIALSAAFDVAGIRVSIRWSDSLTVTVHSDVDASVVGRVMSRANIKSETTGACVVSVAGQTLRFERGEVLPCRPAGLGDDGVAG